MRIKGRVGAPKAGIYRSIVLVPLELRKGVLLRDTYHELCTVPWLCITIACMRPDGYVCTRYKGLK